MNVKISTADDGHFKPTDPTDPVQLFHRLTGADAFASKLPRQRWSHEAKGKLLLLQRTGLVVVPFAERPHGDWAVVVVKGNDTYPVGGHDLYVAGAEIEAAIEVTDLFYDPTRDPNNPAYDPQQG
ncbi:MAG TPA: hypothetical protein VFT75_18455 [Nocardioidaceae bacterium]|nr:hypothetical protein [Nocardioidaceae bacterium]